MQNDINGANGANGALGSPVIVVHGGAGAGKEHEDGCVRAAACGFEKIGQSALAAAISAVVALEDDGRFNAGSGAILCLDGVTVECDAAVMDSAGKLGAVACLRHIRNPVRAAHAVAQTPHWLLAGEGAERLARLEGLAEAEPPGEQVRHRHRRMVEKLHGAMPAKPGVNNAHFERFWNYQAPSVLKGLAGCDTVGAVARDAAGVFAVACSTGGAAPSLLGRVGDTPIIGSGFYAGPCGAVAATGIGEHIVRHLLAHTVYSWIAGGMELDRALQRGIGLFPDNIDVGLIAVSRTDAGALSNRAMPASMVQHD